MNLIPKSHFSRHFLGRGIFSSKERFCFINAFLGCLLENSSVTEENTLECFSFHGIIPCLMKYLGSLKGVEIHIAVLRIFSLERPQ